MSQSSKSGTTPPSPGTQGPLVPAPPDGDQARVVRPKAVDTAFWFAIVGIVLGAIGTVVTTLVDRERVTRLVRDVLDGTAAPYSEQDVVESIGVFRTVGGIGIAIFVGLFVLFAVMMRAGRNWARIVLTAYALFGVVDFLAAVSASGAALDLIWNLAGAAFLVAAVVYLFRPESLTFFAKGKKR